MNVLTKSLAKGLTLLLAIATVSLAVPVVSAYADTAVAPGVPTRVVTSNATGSSLNVSWTAPASDGGAPISDYTIQHRKVGEVSWVPFVHTASTATSVTVTGLSPGSTYLFRVAAVNTVGTSAWSVSGPTLGAGHDHACAIRDNQDVLCWGLNTDGQLGDASTTSSVSPVVVSALDGSTPALTAVSLAVGGYHTCAVMADGSVTCWGLNAAGQLGNGTITTSSTPVPVTGLDGLSPATTAVGVSAGMFHSCAVMADGTAKCWGDDWMGQLGDNATTGGSSRVPVNVSGFDGSTAAKSVVEISATSQNHTCARLADGSVACWGWGSYGQLGNATNTDSGIPVPVFGIDGTSPESTAVSIAIGTGHSCAALADGKAKCWGSNYNADLGDGTRTDSNVPVSVIGTGGATASSTAVAIASSSSSLTCAIMANGSQSCWGAENYGQLGGPQIVYSHPRWVTGLDGATPAGTVMQIATGHYFACSALADSTVACWGKNADGQLGNGSQIEAAAPVAVLDSTGPGSTLSLFKGAHGSTLAAPPGAPTIVSASGATSSSLVVSWTAPSDNGGAAITDYVVQYRLTAANLWSTFTHTASTATSITVTGLATVSSYEFQIAAVNTAGTGAFSSPSNAASTLAVAPGAPTNVSASGATSSSLVVSWTAPNSDGGSAITDYEVQYRLTSADSWATFTHTASTATSITVTGLEPASSYEFQIAAVNTAGTGAFSTPSSAAATLPGAPGTPTNVSASGATSSSLVVSWTAPISDGGSAITDYVVQYRLASANSWSTFTHTASTATSITVTGLASASSYEFQIAAVNTAGTGAFSSPSNAASTLGFAPGAPTNVSASSATSSSLVVSWTAPINDGDAAITDYVVQYRLASANSWSAFTHTASTATSITVTGLVGGSSYEFQIAAVNTEGTGAFSSPSNAASTLAVAPGAPTSVRASSATSSSLVVSWTAPRDGGAPINNYIVEYRQVGELIWSRFDRAASTASSAIVSGLEPDTSYEFRVAAMSSVGTSAWSVSGPTIAAGHDHACAIRDDQDVLCWGLNTDGQLGDASTTNSASPVEVSILDGSTPALTAVSLAVGGYHTCAVMADGSVTCWGLNAAGQLGNGTITTSSTPVPVTGLDGLSPATTAVSVSAGLQHSCAVMADGSAKCWGDDWMGQLGDNATTGGSSRVPVNVSGFDGSTAAKSVVEISATSQNHTCARLADGSVACWGWGSYGQLGNATNTDSGIPVPVFGIDGTSPAHVAVSIAIGTGHSCAALANGQVKCWGSNYNADLGDGTRTDSNVPVAVIGTDGATASSTAVAVASSSSSLTCAIMANGSQSCWGAENYGQLGGPEIVWSYPRWVTGLDGATPTGTVMQIAAGHYFACSGLADSTMVCWGTNSSGQLGNGSQAEAAAPVAVLGSTGPGSTLNIFQGARGRTLPVVAPGAPTSVRASGATSSSLVVSWTAPSDNGGAEITNFVVQYRLASASVWSTFSRTPSPATSVTVTGLAAGSSYVFQVAAVNSVDTGNFTGASAARSTLAAPGRPGRPEIGTRTTSSMRISWDAAASNGSAITNYVVEYRKDTGAWRTFTRPAPSTALSMTVTGLTKGDSYTFRVSAVSAGGTSPTSVVSAAGLAASDPDAPGSVTGKATKVAGQIAVTWTAAALNGAPRATYTISWLVGGKWTTPVTASGFAHTIAKLKPGTYSVRVTATTVEGSASATKAGIVLADNNPLSAITDGRPSLLFG